MAQLSTKIKLYLEANGKVFLDERYNYIVQDDSDGKGAYLKSWNVLGVSQPTEEQLNALDAEATTSESNNQVINTRRTAYGNIGDQLDEIYKDIDAWKARIQQIKSDNPKG